MACPANARLMPTQYRPNTQQSRKPALKPQPQLELQKTPRTGFLNLFLFAVFHRNKAVVSFFAKYTT